MRPIPALVVLALVAGALAGCLNAPVETASTAEASLPRFDATKTIVERLVLTVKDGTKLVLAANASEEAMAAGERMPVIVDIGPYFGTSILEYTAIDMRLAEYFVPRGYVVARASLRGTGESEGCFDIGGNVEQRDVVEIVEFLASQPWSNGNVAVFGKSYDGTTPWMAAINHAKGLKTIVPISGISDMYRYTYYDGVAYPEELLFEPYYYLSVGEDVHIPGPDGGDPAWTGNEATLMSSVNACHADALSQQTRANAQSTITGDHGDPFWVERDYEPRLRDIDVPVFLVHGWQDWNVKPDHEIPVWDRLGVPKTAWFGQWAHDYPDINRHNADWSRHDWNETLLVWFDHWLKDVEGNGWETLLGVQTQDQLGVWRNDSTWPPADARHATMHMTRDGALAAEPGASARASFRDVAKEGYQPATKRGGLAFVTGPMPADVTIVGRPFVDVKVSLDSIGGQLAVALYDVDESGQWTEVDHGARNLWHRESREQGALVTPGEEFNTTVWLYPQEITIQKGHRLALSVGAEHPRWFVRSPFVTEPSIRLGESGSTLSIQVRAESVDALASALAATSSSSARGGIFTLETPK